MTMGGGLKGLGSPRRFSKMGLRHPHPHHSFLHPAHRASLRIWPGEPAPHPWGHSQARHSERHSTCKQTQQIGDGGNRNNAGRSPGHRLLEHPVSTTEREQLRQSPPARHHSAAAESFICHTDDICPLLTHPSGGCSSNMRPRKLSWRSQMLFVASPGGSKMGRG